MTKKYTALHEYNVILPFAPTLECLANSFCISEVYISTMYYYNSLYDTTNTILTIRINAHFFNGQEALP